MGIDVVALHAGSQGEVDTSEDRQRELVRQRLREKEVSTCTMYRVYASKTQDLISARKLAF